MKNFIVRYSILLVSIFSSHFLFSQNQHFTENKGQWPSQVLFKAEFGNGAIFLEKNTITYALYNSGDIKHSHAHHGDEANQKKLNNKINCHAYKVKLLNSNNPKIDKIGISSDYSNYFIGTDKTKWATKVRKFYEINYHEIYNGIDLKVYSTETSYKYDFILAPNADIKQIKMQYDGVDKISVKNGNLVLKTSVQDVVEYKPYVYQKVNGEKKSIKCNYKIEDNILTFDVENYNKSEELIIDPVLIFSTYTGSETDNWGFTATYDNQGNVFSAGIVADFGYPTNTGAYQESPQGLWDIGIMKFSPDGTNRIYATYLGGSGCEMPHSLIANEYNDLIVFGTTGSDNFPTSDNAYDKNFNGGNNLTYDGSIQFPNGSDLYISRISENGDLLIASTYIGGSKNDGLNFKSYINDSQQILMHGNDSLYYNYADGARGEIITDGDNNIYVGTTTFSSDFPVTAGAFQTNFGGKQEGLVFKIDANLSNLMWSSFLGGNEDDAIYSLDVDSEFGVYVTGGTVSHNFPTTTDAYNKDFNGGTTDGFLTYISSDGNNINASTYFGSDQYDQSYNVKLDRFNNPHIVGQTKAFDSTLIKNALYSVPNSGQFIAKFNPQLSNLEWSTVFGTGNGKPNISITAFTVDVCNRIYLAGWGREWAASPPYNTGGSWDAFWNSIDGTKNLPVTADAFQATTDGQDFYIMVISDDASSLDYATFMGEQYYSSCSYSGHDHVDGGTSRFDKKGNIYQSVCASCGGCSGFPTSPDPGVWSPESGASPFDNCNNAVFRFSFMKDFSLADFTLPISGCAPYSVNFQNNSLGANFIWDFGDGTTSTLKNPTHTFTNSGSYKITLISSDPTTCNLSDTISKTIEVLKNKATTNPKIKICPNESVKIGIPASADPNIEYKWTPTTGLNNPTISNPVAKPSLNTIYMLQISNGNCVDTMYQEIEILQNKIDVSTDVTKDICKGETITLTASSNQPLTDFIWATNINFTNQITSINDSTISVNPTGTSTYYVKGTAPYCNYFSIDSVKVRVHESKISAGNDKIICYGDSVQLNVLNLVSGDILNYVWTPISSILSGGNTSKPWVKPSLTTEYTIDVTNQYSCKSTDKIIVTVDKLTADSVLKNVSCFGKCDGEISVTANGISPFVYLWNNSKNTSSINSLCDGNYTLTIIDNIGCKKNMSFEITEPSELTTSIVENPLKIICDSTCNGINTIIVSGGILPYSYTWSNGKSTAKIDKLCVGKYDVTVTDANECKAYNSFTVVDPSDVEITFDVLKPISCFGNCDGIIFISAKFGSPPYFIDWQSNNNLISNSGDSAKYIDLCYSLYLDTLRDSETCVRPFSVNLIQPDSIEASTSFDTIFCNGNKTEISTIVTGGTPFISGESYKYNWNNGQTNSIATNLNPGTYIVTISDANNCQKILTTTITEPDKLIFDSIVKPTTCTQSCDGEILLTVDGGVKPYTYLWSNNFQDSLNPNLCEGNYLVTITDKNNCEIIQNFDIKNVNFIPILDISSSDSIIYIGEHVNLVATNNQNYQYTWEPIQSLNNHLIYNPIASPFVSTNYYLVISDENGCQNNDSIYIQVDDFVCDEPFVFVPNAFTPDGDGNNDKLFVYSKVTSNLYFAIYDRWGEKVFETTNVEEGWDGTFNGKELDPAVYVYYLKVTCVNKTDFVKKGNVTLIR